jgi:hypothetical protein
MHPEENWLKIENLRYFHARAMTANQRASFHKLSLRLAKNSFIPTTLSRRNILLKS